MQPAKNDRSCYCYKKYYAIAILAIADTNFKFQYFNTGAHGAIGDASMWNRSQFRRDLHDTQRYDLPPIFVTPAGNIVGSGNARTTRIDAYVVADSAFALSPRCIKVDPCPRPTAAVIEFNKRVTNCRRVVEQTFARLSGRWNAVKWNHMNDIPFATQASKAAAALHNICQERSVPYFTNWAAALNEERREWSRARQELRDARVASQQRAVHANGEGRVGGERVRKALQSFCRFS